MWVQKTKTGKYAFTERYQTRTGVYKTVSITLEKNTTQSRKQAQRALEERIEEAVKSVGNYTFGDVCDAFLHEQEKSVKLATYKRNLSVSTQLRKILGADSKVDALTAGYIRDQLMSTGKPPVTLNEYVKRLKAILRWGYANDMVSSPAAADKLKGFKDTPHRVKIKDKFMDREELRKVLEATQDDVHKALTAFLALSGLRIGEALALTVDDITDEDIIVNKTYNSAVCKTTPPKTLASNRRVHIQPELKKVIKTLNSLMLIRKLSIGKPDLPLWLIGRNGGHICYEYYSRELKRITTEVLGRPLSPHSLRHTHASILMETLPLEVISRRLGHENSRITREIYAHITEDLQKKDAALIDSASIL